MNLFEDAARSLNDEPLAARMRPRTLDEYIGQEHILGKGRLLRRAIQADQLSSVIFYGPPGTGKTTLARVIANTTKSHFSTLNAVLSGVKELRGEIEDAKNRREMYHMRTILFIDEVHRWNKSQQDALLPWVENGTFILIGATTENPFFEVNAALVSRSRIFQLKKLTDDNLHDIAMQAIHDEERGYGRYHVTFEEGALEHLVSVANGDARSLLNALELAVETTPDTFPPEDGSEIYISKETAEESIQKKAVLYDKEGDYHFDVISAFIKSLRGSDPDAALYWLARMVAAGEDPRFIFRRMEILAAEDVGMADPYAVAVVEADASAFDRIGLPEGRFHLAHSAIYLSTAPKSNSALGFFDALSDVEKEKSEEVPNHLRDASRDSEGFGHGEGYMYPHSYKDHWVAQQYLPTGLQGKIYYKPSDMGYESAIKDNVMLRREAQLEAVTEDLYKENLTFSPGDKARSRWAERALSGRSESLLRLMKRLYSGLDILRSDNVMVLNASHGLLLWPLMKKNPEGLSVAVVRNNEQKEIIEHFSSELDKLLRPVVIVSEARSAFSAIEDGLQFGVISGRNLLSRLESDRNILEAIKSRLEEDGKIALLESIPSLSSRLSDFASEVYKDKLRKAEKKIYSSDNPLTAWGKKELENAVLDIFPEAYFEYEEDREDRYLSKDAVIGFYRSSYAESGMTEQEFIAEFADRTVKWSNTVAIIRSGYKAEKKDNSSFSEWKSVVDKTN
ncbi:MAG: AAA family ATPase [Spirochaetes bacterium]|uniref:Replication-associated recombination protein A n=1 Tax=Candidatus Ornithospirochaeta stercoravium TaxID=2840897 RepID=A0A9D9IC90_9SPIO|nr:AAA family ATPase [Candidatus Ornithospirochaeta stercoravium]